MTVSWLDVEQDDLRPKPRVWLDFAVFWALMVAMCLLSWAAFGLVVYLFVTRVGW